MNFFRRQFGWIILFLGAMFFLSACGETETPAPLPTDTPAPTRAALVLPTAAPGWKIGKRADFQIALPDTWQEIKLDANALQAAIVAAQDRNPPLAEQLRALLESGQTQALIFYAADTTPALVARNVAISRVNMPPNQDLKTFAKTYADALPNIVRGAQVREVQAPLKINGMNAAAIVYDVSLVDRAEKLTTLRGVQYLYVLDSGAAYMVTVTGDAADAEKFTPLARQLATSFAITTR